jgi:outer membrane lipase/esterase
MTKRYLTAACVAAVLIAAASTAPAQAKNSSTAYVFGDSLSDTGNLFAEYGTYMDPTFAFYYGTPMVFDGAGWFSNGPVWSEYLTATPNNDLVTYAYGGATSADYGVPSRMAEPPAALLTTGFLTQVTDFIAGGGSLNRNDAAFVWAGANDYLFGLNLPETVLSNLATGMGMLADDEFGAGAGTIVVMNLPDLGATPLASFISEEDAALLSAASAGHNIGLASVVDGLRLVYPDTDFIVVDIYAAFNQLIDSPESFGFTNATDSCLLNSGTMAIANWSANCIDNAGTSFDPFDDTLTAEAEGYVFWDLVHPTTQAHEIIAEFVAATMVQNSMGLSVAAAQADFGRLTGKLPLAATAARLDAAHLGVSGFGLLGNGFAESDPLARQLAMASTGPEGQSADGAWMGLTRDAVALPATGPLMSVFVYDNGEDGAWARSAGRAGFTFEAETRSFGMDYRLDDNMLVGIMYGESEATGTIDGGASAEVTGSAFVLYGSYMSGGFHADAMLGMSEQSYDDIARTTGSRLFPTARGETAGTTTHAGLETGYTHDGGWLRYGPVAGLEWSRNLVDAYTETGAGPLNLSYGEQAGEVVTGRLGFEGAAEFDTAVGLTAVRFGVSWERELAGGEGTVRASLPGGYTQSLSADTAAGNTVRLDAGVGVRLAGGVTGTLGLQSTFSETQGESHEALARLKVVF